MITLNEFYNELAAHNWFFDMTSKGKEWHYWKENETKIKKIAATGGDQYRELFDSFIKHHFSGPAYGTDVIDLPARPKTTRGIRKRYTRKS